MPLRVWRHHGITFYCLRGLHPNKKDNAKRQKMNGESLGVKLLGHRGSHGATIYKSITETSFPNLVTVRQKFDQMRPKASEVTVRNGLGMLVEDETLVSSRWNIGFNANRGLRRS